MIQRMISMQRLLQKMWLILAFAGIVSSASGFTPLGPFDTWQTTRIGYNIGPPFADTDIGGPMVLGDEYRWNLKTITYGFDNSFKTYFGERGMEEVRKAIAILNNLPSMSKVSTDLREFETDTRRINYRASALDIIDLKSYALGMLVEELGLASPERYVWCLRFRLTPPGAIDYHVIQRNFDPVNLGFSKYVNDTLYTYTVLEFNTSPAVADAVELPVDPLAFQFTAVASSIDGNILGGSLFPGDFFTGLTRDDVGGLRYIYGGKGRYKNSNIETLISDVTTNGVVSSGGSPWSPVITTQTNTIVATALRPGIDKLHFREAKYDSTLGFFLITTNTYVDTYIQGSKRRTQRIQRVVAEPDIIFGAQDLGDGILLRTDTTSWANNTATNNQVLTAGPGVIQPPVFIVFSKLGPELDNQTTDFLDEQTALLLNPVWGSYDGTTNEPVIYPLGTSVMDVERRVLNGH